MVSAIPFQPSTPGQKESSMRHSKVTIVCGCVIFTGLFATPQLETPRLFKPPQTYPGGGAGGAFQLATGDLTGDGKVDLVVADLCLSVADCSTGGVGILLGAGDGTFQNGQTIASGGVEALSVAVGDVNGDGLLDVVVANQCQSVSNCTRGAVGVLLGNGDGTFQAVRSFYSGGYYASAIAVEDVDGDGKLDLLVVNSCVTNSDCKKGDVGVLLGNGDGTFHAAQSYSSDGAYPAGIAVADVNGDGKLDLIVANNSFIGNQSSGAVTVLLGNGDGTFQPAVGYASGGQGASAVAAIDVNGDGKLDLLVANVSGNSAQGAGALGVLLGNGDGTFQPAQSYSTSGSSSFSVAVADVSGDGKPDAIVSNYCGINDPACTSPSVTVFLGSGNGSFTASKTYKPGGLYTESVAVADVNGDGRPDLLVDNFSPIGNSDANIAVLLSTAHFATTTRLSSDPDPSAYGQLVTLTAKVSSVDPGIPIGGGVTFNMGEQSLGFAKISDGVATLKTTKLAVGQRTITATYGGDSVSDKSVSPELVQIVK
jgi:uncharacterized protein (DUF2141 family)